MVNGGTEIDVSELSFTVHTVDVDDHLTGVGVVPVNTFFDTQLRIVLVQQRLEVCSEFSFNLGGGFHVPQSSP